MYITNIPSHRRAQNPSGESRECLELAACDLAAKRLGIYGRVEMSAHCGYLRLYKNDSPEIWKKIILKATTLSNNEVLLRATEIWHIFYDGVGHFCDPNGFNPDTEEE